MTSSGKGEDMVTTEGQLSLFDFGKEAFRIKKKIRLIELFGGIGAQSKSLEALGADFENWRYVEWCYKSIASYKAIHFPEDRKDYSEGMSVHDVRKFIADSGVSDDWNSPMGERKAMALPERKARMIFNDIKASRCIPDITKAKASDFGISENGYCYVMTYSFPCQDLSLAGKRKGMAKGGGTRSGMLWEVERILREMRSDGKVPDVLVMENVPQVTKDSVSWNGWLQFLESIGYTSVGGVLNAKDFGIPQNRERFFLVSALGDYAVGFPGAKIVGRHCLKDFCEAKAERRFFITEDQLKGIVSWGRKHFNPDDFAKDCIGTIETTQTKGMAKFIGLDDAPKPLQNIEGETARPILSSEGGRGNQYNYIGIATDCDGISTNDSESHFRGPLKGLSRTIKTDGKQGAQIEVVGNMNGHQSGNVYSSEGIAPSLCAHTHGETNESYAFDKQTVVLLNSSDEKGKERHLQDRIYSEEGISPTINATPSFSPSFAFGGNEIIQIGNASKDRDGFKNPTAGRVYSPEGISPTLNTDGGGSHIPLVSCDANGLGVYGIGGKFLYVRRLMPIEAWRLMGFGSKDYELASESLKRFRKESFPLSHEAWLYHEAGDSIVVTVLMAVFGELLGVGWEGMVGDYAEGLMRERGKTWAR